MAIHAKEDCRPPCPFHAPSGHHMRSWRSYVRLSGLVERICPHGIGHPDPDSQKYLDPDGKHAFGVHGCDGCCRAAKAETAA